MFEIYLMLREISHIHARHCTSRFTHADERSRKVHIVSMHCAQR